jgi:hypothetical protein
LQVQASSLGQGHQVPEQDNLLQGEEEQVEVETWEEEGSQDKGKVDCLISSLETTSERTPCFQMFFWMTFVCKI